MNYLTKSPFLFKETQLALLDAAIKEASISMSKLFQQELDRVFREAVVRECGAMPDDRVLRSKGQIVIDSDYVHRLLWKRDDGKYHEIAAVTCQFGKVSLPPTF